jgi:NADH dehydrogenase
MKAAAEELVRAGGPAWTILRPGAFLELWLWFLCARLPDKAVVFGRGDNPINQVSVEDVAWMVDRALCDPVLRGQTIDMGGPDNVSHRQLVHTFCRVTGATRPVRSVPRAVLRLMRHPMRAFNPVIARHMHSALWMDTDDMTFDAQPLKQRFPELPFVTTEQAITRDYRA